MQKQIFTALLSLLLFYSKSSMAQAWYKSQQLNLQLELLNEGMNPGVGVEYLVGSKFRIGPKIGFGFFPRIVGQILSGGPLLTIPTGLSIVYGQKHNIEAFIGTYRRWDWRDEGYPTVYQRFVVQAGYRLQVKRTYFRIKYGIFIDENGYKNVSTSIGIGLRLLPKKAML